MSNNDIQAAPIPAPIPTEGRIPTVGDLIAALAGIDPATPIAIASPGGDPAIDEADPAGLAAIAHAPPTPWAPGANPILILVSRNESEWGDEMPLAAGPDPRSIRA